MECFGSADFLGAICSAVDWEATLFALLQHHYSSVTWAFLLDLLRGLLRLPGQRVRALRVVRGRAVFPRTCREWWESRPMPPAYWWSSWGFPSWLSLPLSGLVGLLTGTLLLLSSRRAALRLLPGHLDTSPSARGVGHGVAEHRTILGGAPWGFTEFALRSEWHTVLPVVAMAIFASLATGEIAVLACVSRGAGERGGGRGPGSQRRAYARCMAWSIAGFHYRSGRQSLGPSRHHRGAA